MTESTSLVPVKRALISVYDKTGLNDLARALHEEFGVELISTGGSANALRAVGLPVRDVADVTGFPEMMDGRVKTLHPMIHGGLLAVRDDPAHATAMRERGIGAIDLVCINLYPFEQTIARPGVTIDEAIEQIDIGGPSMIRSGAKNHRYVLVVTDPSQYPTLLTELREHRGASTATLRRTQAQRAFDTTSRYDTAIAGYLQTLASDDVASNDPPDELSLRLIKRQSLRYGENPHQKAGLYVGRDAVRSAGAEASVAFARQLHGKELSYINLLDADAALSAVKEFAEGTPAACIVKHATPCGYATAADLATAFTNAFAGDPLAAFGGIVALNQPVDLPTARAIVSIDKLLEVIVAPDYAADALELLRTRWKNVRLLAVGPLGTPNSAEPSIHTIAGGYLVQQRDLLGVDEGAWKVVSRRAPTAREIADLKLAWLACKHVKSNAIALARDGMMVGSGAGQQDRVNAARIAVAKAGERARGSAAGSDAFFPFPDGPELLLAAGVTALIHPGGSVNDADSIAAADRAGTAMILTGQRHFRH